MKAKRKVATKRHIGQGAVKGLRGKVMRVHPDFYDLVQREAKRYNRTVVETTGVIATRLSFLTK